jgi:hypothetical protein
MFDKLVQCAKSAKDALEALCKKRSANTGPSAKKPEVAPEASTEQVDPPAADKPFKKPDFPIVTIVFLVTIIVAAIYVEWHLLAITAGIMMALILITYLTIQKAVDAANFAAPDPGDDPGPWPWPTSDSMGGAAT